MQNGWAVTRTYTFCKGLSEHRRDLRFLLQPNRTLQEECHPTDLSSHSSREDCHFWNTLAKHDNEKIGDWNRSAMSRQAGAALCYNDSNEPYTLT